MSVALEGMHRLRSCMIRRGEHPGTQVVSYTYDVWGKALSTTGTLANTIGNINLIRYRGYYYDYETGFYYLQTRYYDPEIGRFINADGPAILTATPTGLTDKNLYSYCDNNPIIRNDSGGMFWDVVLDIVSWTCSAYDVITDPKDINNWASLGLDTLDLVVPVVSGTGEVYKAYNKVDNVIDAAQNAKRFGNLSKAAKYGIDTYNKLRKKYKEPV